MKKWLLTILTSVVLSLCVAGCGEPFAGGFVAGVASYEDLAGKAQDDFVEAVNALNAETTKINNNVDNIEGSILVKPETLEAVKGLKGREKDPVTWVALASILANAFWGGKTVGSRKQ